MLVVGTGARDLALLPSEQQQVLCAKVMNKLEDLGATEVYSGGAEGFDACLAFAAYTLGIPYKLFLPNPGYLDYYWRRKSVTGRDRSGTAALMVARASGIHHSIVRDLYGADPHQANRRVHANFIRNHDLLKDGDCGFVYKPESSGTQHGVKELVIHEVPYVTIS